MKIVDGEDASLAALMGLHFAVHFVSRQARIILRLVVKIRGRMESVWEWTRRAARLLDNFDKYIPLRRSTRKWSPINFSRDLKEEVTLLPALKIASALGVRSVGRYVYRL